MELVTTFKEARLPAEGHRLIAIDSSLATVWSLLLVRHGWCATWNRSPSSHCNSLQRAFVAECGLQSRRSHERRCGVAANTATGRFGMVRPGPTCGKPRFAPACWKAEQANHIQLLHPCQRHPLAGVVLTSAEHRQCAHVDAA